MSELRDAAKDAIHAWYHHNPEDPREAHDSSERLLTAIDRVERIEALCQRLALGDEELLDHGARIPARQCRVCLAEVLRFRHNEPWPALMHKPDCEAVALGLLKEDDDG